MDKNSYNEENNRCEMQAVAKILLIDDNPTFLEDALPFYGYDVEVALNGVQALKKLNSKHDEKFDLILLDVMMPQMDGWETLKAIRENKNYKSVPIIMATAVNDEQKQITGLKLGADDYITKPFILPNLLARIDALLRRVNWQEEQTPGQIVFQTDGVVANLTPMETKVLKLAAEGASNQEIAEALVVRPVTVKTHMYKIFKKLNVSNRTQAILLAIQMKIINK